MKYISAQYLFFQLLIAITVLYCVGNGSARAHDSQGAQPKTIAFRFDDVQDGWLSGAQRAVIELFARENLKLSLGIIGGYIGKDENLVGVIRSNGNILSLANHGLHAKNARDGRSLLLSQSSEATREEILAAEQNLLSVLGVAAKTFIPHQNEFNDNILQIISGLGYTHISSACGTHIGTDYCPDDCGNRSGGPTCGTPDIFGLIHVPAGASINWQPVVGGEIYSIERILQEIAKSIEYYCFAVIMLHPQDFATTEEALDLHKLRSLSALLGEIKSRFDSLEVVWLEEIESRCQ